MGVGPRVAPFVWREFPHPDRILRCDPTSPAGGRGEEAYAAAFPSALSNTAITSADCVTQPNTCSKFHNVLCRLKSGPEWFIASSIMIGQNSAK